VVLVLALGVGANLATLDLVDALMFRPPAHVHEADQLVNVPIGRNYVAYLDLIDRTRTLDLAALTGHRIVGLSVSHDVLPIQVECVTDSYFAVLGTSAAVGRVLQAGEDKTARPTVVLSYGLWTQSFGRDPAIAGRSITIADRGHLVAGIAPQGFKGIALEPVDAWVLISGSPEMCSFTGRSLLASSSGAWLNTIGRLRPGVTLEQAQADMMAGVPPDWAGGRPELARPSALFASRRSAPSRDSRLAMWLAGGAFVVLLIACANAAGLLLIRAIDRRRELGVRLQLGAGRARVLSQVIAEHVVLAAVAGVAALLVAWTVRALLSRFFPPTADGLLPHSRLLFVGAGLTILSGLLSGVMPAIRMLRTDAAALTRASGVSAREGSRMRSVLLVVQVALALALVVVAGLFVRSVQNTRRGLGVDLERLVIVTFDQSAMVWRGPREVRAMFDLAADRTRALSGVESVALSSSSVLGSGPARIAPSLPSEPGEPNRQRRLIEVSPNYFTTLGTRIVRGRPFTEDDEASGRRVMVVSASEAHEAWPGQDPVGRHHCFAGGACFEIVGVSETRRLPGLARTNYELFEPLSTSDEPARPLVMLIRTRHAVVDAVGPIAAVIRAAAPKPLLANVRPAEDLADQQTRAWRLGRVMFSLFGLAALFLASLGLFALLAFSARQRTAEIGVRIALGATAWQVLGLFARQGLVLVAAGWVAGLVAAGLGARYLESVLFQVEPMDAATFGVASLVLAIAALIGVLIPAARATRVDPVAALREE
jgi:predicted permease